MSALSSATERSYSKLCIAESHDALVVLGVVLCIGEGPDQVVLRIGCHQAAVLRPDVAAAVGAPSAGPDTLIGHQQPLVGAERIVKVDRVADDARRDGAVGLAFAIALVRQHRRA